MLLQILPGSWIVIWNCAFLRRLFVYCPLWHRHSDGTRRWQNRISRYTCATKLRNVITPLVPLHPPLQGMLDLAWTSIFPWLCGFCIYHKWLELLQNGDYRHHVFPGKGAVINVRYDLFRHLDHLMCPVVIISGWCIQFAVTVLVGCGGQTVIHSFYHAVAGYILLLFWPYAVPPRLATSHHLFQGSNLSSCASAVSE